MIKNIAFSTKVTLNFLCSGIFMTLAGVLFELTGTNDSLLIKCFLLLSFVLVGVFKILTLLLNSTQGDEMSAEHFKRVKAHVYGSLMISIVFFGIIGVIASFFHYTLIDNWYGWLLMFLGIQELLAGREFINMERAGDE